MGYEGRALEGQVVSPKQGRAAEKERRKWWEDVARKVEQSLRFTLDGAPVDVTQFIADNELDAEQIVAIHNLQPGETMNFGGGASATFVLRREGGGA